MSRSYPELKGKVAIVTGAGRAQGLGAAIALRLGAEGASVVIHDIGRAKGDFASASYVGFGEEMESVAKAVRDAGGQATTFSGDMLVEADVEAMVKEAVDEIDRESATSVLIIEDEPLISMQLEDLVRSLGHEICGTAATRTQAQEVVAERTPGLVLADIQLADGSSGLDAVDDILAIDSVPVIFITAYPERLLTGDRPEPTYLVTKPFQESTVRAAISQALFFGSSRPLH